jgi:hypothetical protein
MIAWEVLDLNMAPALALPAWGLFLWSRCSLTIEWDFHKGLGTSWLARFTSSVFWRYRFGGGIRTDMYPRKTMRICMPPDLLPSI